MSPIRDASRTGLENTRSANRKKTNKPARLSKKWRPRVELLEDRLAPATHIWTGGGDGIHWSDGGNWDTGAPANGEAGDIIVQFNGGVSSTDDIGGLIVDQVHFTAGGNTI